MRLIAGGPDIPDTVRRDLEASNLILFCGAGVSMPGSSTMPGMPSFAGLVEQVYLHLPDSMSLLERASFDGQQYDRTLHVLERRVSRPSVRRVVHQVLTKSMPSKRHEALLELARLRDGTVRMVTTNFDRQFDEAAAALGWSHSVNVAPMLPIPKPHRWASLVYLHGRIPPGSDPDDPALNSLVLTSGDFGLAYLTERWASRFVTDLFAKYPVLFVGYSLNDPVMRYLMDAFAADRDQSGDSSPTAWAFAPCDNDADEAAQVALWRGKGVEPIPYRVQPGYDHSALYRTLDEWAKRKRQGLDARIALAKEAAAHTPAPPFDDAILDGARWAFEDVAAVRAFTTHVVAPPIEWLSVLDGWELMGGAHPSPGSLSRCAPGASALSDTSHLLGDWLTRHLDQPEALEWIVQGGMPHPDLQWLIRNRLSMAVALGRPPKSDERPSVSPPLEQAWRLLASPVVRSNALEHSELPGLVDRIAEASTDPLVRESIRRQLTPYLRLGSASNSRALMSTFVTGYRPTTMRDFIEAKVRLGAKDRASGIRDIFDNHPDRKVILCEMADDLTTLLIRSLDLLRMAGDEATYPRASIPRHEQDRYREGWTVLIDLASDAMAVLRTSNPDAAEALLSRWKTLDHPLFRRMVMHEYRDRI